MFCCSLWIVCLLQPAFVAIWVAFSCLFLSILPTCLCWEAESVGAIVHVLNRLVPCSVVLCCAVLCYGQWCVVNSITARCVVEARTSIFEKVLSDKAYYLRGPMWLRTRSVVCSLQAFVSRTSQSCQCNLILCSGPCGTPVRQLVLLAPSVSIELPSRT